MMKQVKVDNWGIYFLQRLKHFFNRTDYCDLTLQFMDNAQLKVHRLVLNACTEYFDVLERTCEMYEDYLIMPDDLQADVVVPIVNFMYTGQLEYKPEMLEKLIQTAQIMNIPVLAKLLDAQRNQKTYMSKPVAIAPKVTNLPLTTALRKPLPKPIKRPAPLPPPSKPPPPKRPYVPKKTKLMPETPEPPIFVKLRPPRIGHNEPYMPMTSKQRYKPPAPGPTRCELPEDLEENIFTDSFSTISYDSKPLIVHPETIKRYAAVKQHSLYSDVLSGRKSSTIDIIHNKIKKPIENLFEDFNEYYDDDVQFNSEKTENKSHIFDEVLKNTPKVTIESDDDQQGTSIDHAKIISEVLKKYPYLVKGNKSIKLKILDTKQPTKPKKTAKKTTKSPKVPKVKVEPPASDDTPKYPSDMLDSKQAAHLISLGAENVSGPWICMICGTPGKALSFSSYYSFRRHLVEVHHEKIISNRCEYCGYKTNKLSYLLYHLFTKHDVPPPQHCNFPKCSECGFIAQNPANLVKHKMIHSTKKKKCGVCFFEFTTTANLMRHIKVTGHKVSSSIAHANQDIQCVYCSKMFIREQNLYVHLKASHGLEAKRDGIVEDSDEEHIVEDELECEESEVAIKRTRQLTVPDPLNIKREPNLYNSTYDSEESVDALGTNNELVSATKPAPAPVTQRLLNASFEVEIANQPEEDITNDEFDPKITVRDANTNEFILPNSEFTQNNQTQEEEYHVTDYNEENESPLGKECSEETQNVISDIQQPINEDAQQVQIVVSNEEEYKALMASNHPIIFDADGNPTKTLAVLTTPQSVPMLSTPMQIESENTDNMMVLPEEYGCVSQTTNDGNIVVVYSQQLTGENKQYIVDNSFTQTQIVSAADLNAHFIQTTAVVTPSYTSAASSTIVQGQVVIPQSIVSWDGNAAQEIVTQQAHAPDHIEIVQEQENMAEETIELANEEVDAQPNDQYEMQDQNDVSQSIEAESDSQGTLENIQLIENDSVSTDDIQLVQEESCSQSAVEDANKLSENVGQEQTSMVVSNNELPSNEVEIEDEVIHDEPNETESMEVTECRVSTTEVMTNGSNVNCNASKQHNIENLTSEWSDDDVQTATVEQDDGAGTEEVTLEEAVETEDGVIVEESIENIQQEVDSHTNQNDLDQDITENENDLNQDINVNDFNKETIENNIQESDMAENVALETEPNNLIKTQHKITSLLNDWVENDAQEEEEEENTEINQESSMEEAVESAVMEEGTVMEIVTESGAENVTKMGPNPDIHNLVNDWEEEEETNE